MPEPTEEQTEPRSEPEEYNVTERVQVRDECIAANDETIQEMATKYGWQIKRDGSLDSLRLEFLTDYIFPPSTPLRLEFDIQFEVFFKARLEAIERKLSKQKFLNKLQIPGAGRIQRP